MKKSLARKLSVFFAGIVFITCLVLVGLTVMIFGNIEDRMKDVLYENTLQSYKTEVKSEVQSAKALLSIIIILVIQERLTRQLQRRMLLKHCVISAMVMMIQGISGLMTPIIILSCILSCLNRRGQTDMTSRTRMV